MSDADLGMVFLQHATPCCNVRGIRHRGLLAKLSQGKAKRVWLHAPGETLWAIQHVAKRHGVIPQNCVVFRVRVDPTRIRRGPRKGLFWIAGDVPPADVLIFKTAETCLANPEGWE